MFAASQSICGGTCSNIKECKNRSTGSSKKSENQLPDVPTHHFRKMGEKMPSTFFDMQMRSVALVFCSSGGWTLEPEWGSEKVLGGRPETNEAEDGS